jgi:hypothetical protein
MFCGLLFQTACSSDDPPPDGGDPEPSLDAEACEHMSEGPYNDVTATYDPIAAPDVSAEHTAHRIQTLKSTFVGHVAFLSDAAGDVIFFRDNHTPFEIEDSTGALVPIEESCDWAACSSECDLLARRDIVHLEVGTYLLAVGPTSEPSVTLVHEREAHEHE